MKLKKLIFPIIASTLIVNSAFASSPFNTNEKEMMAVAKKMLPSTEIKKVMPTEIPSMLAVLMGNEEVIYIYPPKALILVGEIYNTKGVNITDKHIQEIGAKKVNNDDKPLDIAPLFNVSVKIKAGSGKYGFIVFTDPDCPFCKQLDSFLPKEDITIDYIYTPLDQLHPNAREKSINIVMQKRSLTREEATKLINEGEKLSTALGVNGTPSTIVYDKESRKPVNGIGGADPKLYAPYFPVGAKQ